MIRNGILNNFVIIHPAKSKVDKLIHKLTKVYNKSLYIRKDLSILLEDLDGLSLPYDRKIKFKGVDYTLAELEEMPHTIDYSLRNIIKDKKILEKLSLGECEDIEETIDESKLLEIDIMWIKDRAIEKTINKRRLS